MHAGYSQKVYHGYYAVNTSGGRVDSKSELVLHPDSKFSLLDFNVDKIVNINYDSTSYYGHWSITGNGKVYQ